MYDIVKQIKDEITRDELKEQEKEKQRERNEMQNKNRCKRDKRSFAKNVI